MSRLHACTPARLHACTPARLHACTPARLHACTHTMKRGDRTRRCTPPKTRVRTQPESITHLSTSEACASVPAPTTRLRVCRHAGSGSFRGCGILLSCTPRALWFKRSCACAQFQWTSDAGFPSGDRATPGMQMPSRGPGLASAVCGAPLPRSYFNFMTAEVPDTLVHLR